MMKNNLFKRLLSSVFLIFIFYLILIVENYLFIIFLILLFLISAYEWNNLVKKKLLKFIGFLLLTFSFFTVNQIKNIDNNNNFFVFIILVSIGSDFGGYLIGKIFGGPKLTKISPNKTYSGFFGGFLFSILFCNVYTYKFNLSFFNYTFDIINLNFLIILLSLISQLGDLAISYYKRKAGIQDTGNIIPGHGGLLDRIDGMIFTFPIFYLFKIIYFDS